MTPSRDHLREHIASIVDRGPYSLADTILRLGGVDGPDLLALSASGGREDFGQLMAACESAMAAGTRMPGTYRLRTLGALASMLVGRQFREPRHTTAARLFRYVHEQHGSQGQSKVFGRLMVQTNLAAGELDFVRRVIAEPAGASEAFDDEIRWMARAELLSPGVLGDDFDAAAWLDVFNEPIIAAGASAVMLRDGDGDGAPFDRLAAGVQQSDAVKHVATDGPLISVVMSVHAPDHSLPTAVHSILAQSWTNLELLVIDDCSPAEFAPVLDKVAGLDPRIRLLRMAENGGTYRIRNRALREARGDLITFQDSDDWSHPERLARQAAPLAEQPGLVATLSASARVSADLSLNAVGYSPTRTNMSSLMFRREPVADRLGGFDTVRKGADSEFFERLVLTYGEPSVLRMPDVMAAVQLTTESLSRGDFSFRWQAPSRVVYREAFQRWHAHIVAGTSSPFLDDIGPRRFPAPYRFLHKGDLPAETTDVLLVSDWRDIAGADGHAAASVRALVGAGLDVSIAHTETLRAATRSRSQTLVEALEMREDGTASWVIWDEPRHARVTVVDDPELMMLRTARGSRLTTDRLLLLAASPPRPAADGVRRFDPAVVERQARELFGVEASWVPADDDVAVALRAEGAEGAILPADHLEVVEVRNRPFAGLRAGPGPVVGTSAERRGAAPLPDRLRALLPAAWPTTWPTESTSDASTPDIRVWGTERPLASLLTGRVQPPGWLLLSAGRLEDYIDQLDIFVAGTDGDGRDDRLTHIITLALSRGCLAIIDPSWEARFGPAALYARAGDEVIAAIEQVIGDAHFADQQQAGYRWCTANLSSGAFAASVARLGGIELSGPTCPADQNPATQKRPS